MNPLLQRKAEQDEPPQGQPALLPQDRGDQGYMAPGVPPNGEDEARLMKALGMRGASCVKEAALVSKIAKYFRQIGYGLVNQPNQNTVCPKCGKPIAPGAMVEWSGGVEAHAGACPTAQQPGQSRINFPKGFQPKAPQQPRTGAKQKMTMTVVEEDGYVKVKHPRLGTVCAGVPGSDGKVHNIEFLDPAWQKNNMYRMPAMAALQNWEWKQSQKTGAVKTAGSL